MSNVLDPLICVLIEPIWTPNFQLQYNPAFPEWPKDDGEGRRLMTTAEERCENSEGLYTGAKKSFWWNSRAIMWLRPIKSVFVSPKDRLGTIVDPRHRILHNHFPKTKANTGSRKWQEGRPKAWKSWLHSTPYAHPYHSSWKTEHRVLL